MDYGVEIKHKVDNGNKVVTKAGLPVYRVKSHGFTALGGSRAVEGEINRVPNFQPPSAVYSKAPVLITGKSTTIDGMDHCGSVQMPAIITPTSTVNQEGSPVINGAPSVITDSTLDISLRDIAEYFRGVADFTYRFQENQVLRGYSDQWGGPVCTMAGSAPLTYAGSMNTIYINMEGDKMLSLQGHTHGAGMLIVNGNLRVSGEFSWYGVIVVTGSLSLEGGARKKITGGILAGETATTMTDIAGDADILYCSEAIGKLKGKTPLKIVRWRQI
jgi:hypothetical protein